MNTIKPGKPGKPRGFVLYDGPSILDQKPIVVIATLETSNEKTGDMVQTWIIRKDIAPHDAQKSGDDISVCGHCPHRNGTCYVTTFQAPLAVFKGFHRGIYPALTPALAAKYLKGRAIRFGAYGDPAAAPTRIWTRLAKLASHHTGYTHQMAHKKADKHLATLVMVSADSPKQAAKYQALGYRTFRVKNENDGFAENEIECLADSKGLTCIDCGLCDGATGRPNIAITVHGSGATKFNTANIIQAINV
jgi:hypothetical protein